MNMHALPALCRFTNMAEGDIIREMMGFLATLNKTTVTQYQELNWSSGIRPAKVWVDAFFWEALEPTTRTHLQTLITGPAHSASYNNRHHQFTLKQITPDTYPLPLTHMELKGATLPDRDPLYSYLGHALTLGENLPSPSGGMQESHYAPAPQAALLFEQAIREFAVTTTLTSRTSSLTETSHIPSVLTKYPAMIGLYTGRRFFNQPLGILGWGLPKGGEKRFIDGLLPQNPSAPGIRKLLTPWFPLAGKALSFLHQNATLNPYLHPGNLSLLPNDHLLVHDLDNAWQAFLDPLSKEQLMTGITRDLFTGRQLTGLHPDIWNGTPTESDRFCAAFTTAYLASLERKQVNAQGPFGWLSACQDGIRTYLMKQEIPFPPYLENPANPFNAPEDILPIPMDHLRDSLLHAINHPNSLDQPKSTEDLTHILYPIFFYAGHRDAENIFLNYAGPGYDSTQEMRLLLSALETRYPDTSDLLELVRQWVEK